ncbi:MAG: metal-dependent hydrolase [Methanosarcinales archaeon]|nr:metal-dependent hydrolase [Methanosarcinales archaeon]
MKQQTHAACGILLASLAVHFYQSDPLITIFWAVFWSLISDFDVYIPTVRHRGITHSLAFALFPGAVVLAIGQFHLYAALASLSVILHLIMDSLNPGGVPLWLPLSTKRVRFPVIGGRVKSDNLIANLLIRFVAIGAAILVILT